MKIPHLFGRIALAASMLLGSLAAQATEFRSSDIHPEDYPTVLAVRHMGETARGNWTLLVSDEQPGDTGRVISWEVVLYGH